MRHALIIVTTLVLAACHRGARPDTTSVATISTAAETETATAPPPRLQLERGPVSFTIAQRAAYSIPQSSGQVVVVLGDITRGQVLTTVQLADHTILAGPKSMYEGEMLPFTLDRRHFTLVLIDFDLAMLKTDYATFRLTQIGDADDPTGPLNEAMKIDLLINHVATLHGALFIRDGKMYTPAEAADQMRNQRMTAGDELTTASQFIDAVARAAWESDSPYIIRLADGRIMEAQTYLHDQLAKLEGTAKPSQSEP